MCRAELLFYFLPMYFYCRNKTLQLFFRFQGAKLQWFARNILNHRQTFERPSLGYVYNFRKGSVPSVFRWTMPGTMPSPNNQQMQKELNLFLSFPEKVVRDSDFFCVCNLFVLFCYRHVTILKEHELLISVYSQYTTYQKKTKKKLQFTKHYSE